MGAPILGIDLGTTNSLCGVFEAGAPRLIKNAGGGLLTPSLVGVLDGGRVVVGAAARELAVTRPEQVSRCFKRHMGTDTKVTLGSHTFDATQLSSLVLRALKADAEADLGVEVTEAVISVPAYFNEHQRQATKLAGEMAGLRVRRILNEPTAAALAYGLVEPDADRRLLVFDLGGGTFDVTIMTVFEGTLEIRATAGDGRLGGEDFTDRLVAAALRERGLLLERVEVGEPLRLSRLRAECERAKRELSAAEEVEVRFPDALGRFGDDRLRLSRQLLRERSKDLLAQLLRPLERALADARLEASELDDVLLVGGASRMPLVVDVVRERLGREPTGRLDPDQVVALGAAVQAGLVARDRALDDVVLTDVCPCSLGVSIAKRMGDDRLRGGYFLPVIHRNTTIPVSREEVVATIHAGQTSVTVRVYQGESRRVEENLLLGELEVVGLPPDSPEGLPIHLRFTYDLNGLLEVEAYVPANGLRARTVITHTVQGLDPAHVAQAVEALQRLKFYPRDELPHQELLRYAERQVGELPPAERAMLEAALDEFERALDAGDRARFAAARARLVTTLAGLGRAWREGSAS